MTIAVASTVIAVEGIWGFAVHRHWTFTVLTVLLILALAFASLKDVSRKSVSSLLAHSGLLIVLLGGLFGAHDRIEVQAKLYLDGEETNAGILPFSISLEDFDIERYADGTSPRQFTSRLKIDGKSVVTSVNHPCQYKGYRIYQAGYDVHAGEFSILKIVRDPWLPVAALGALLLIVAAFLSLKTVWNSWKILPAALILAVAFGAVSVARINFGTLPPALRSLWFAPHLIIYMLAYAIMALSFAAGTASLFSKKIPEGLSRKLLSTASSLLLVGMICGAVWAQQAWGNYWTWDGKECWAAATWLLTLAGMHVRKKKAALVFTILAFMAIQMTWYGVNYLPSAVQSLHTYNQ